jgi:hypothetical protein
LLYGHLSPAGKSEAVMAEHSCAMMGEVNPGFLAERSTPTTSIGNTLS